MYLYWNSITQSLMKDGKVRTVSKKIVYFYTLDNYKVTKMVIRVLIMCFVALTLGSDSDAQNNEIFTIFI